MGDENWISKVETGGKGRSMGIEFLFKKNSGNWTGFLSYVYSSTTRQFMNINGGKQYPFDYNRPNNLSLNLNRKIGNNLNFNIVWIYQSGLPYTEAIGRQYIPSVTNDFEGDDFFYEGLIYGERNGARMKDYHRLDIGLTWTHYNRRFNKVDWNFSIYNLYNRHNPMFYYYNSSRSLSFLKPQQSSDFKPISLYQLSIFPVIPSVSYKVYFDPVARKARQVSEKTIALQKSNESKSVSSITSGGSNIKDRWNIKASYSIVLTGNTGPNPFRHKRYNFELNYGFLDYIEAGIYGGYSSVKLVEFTSASSGRFKTTDGYLYGLNCNFHLLPFLIKKDDPKLDLYINGKLGGITIKQFKSFEEHSIGGGATIYLSKHLGIFGEYNYGKFLRNHSGNQGNILYYQTYKKVNLGFSVKFK